MRRRTRLASVTALVAATALAGCSGARDVAKSGEASASTSTSSTSSTDSPTTGTNRGLPAGFGDGPPGQGLDRFYHQDVTWQECGGGDECADIWVPLDYSDPNGQAVTLKARRAPAGDPAKRRGTLFINPGGPGASGIDYLGYANFDQSITDAYDLVGFDPRGVASSTPVDCVSDADLDAYVASDPSPDTPAEVKDFADTWSQFTSGCEQNSGPLLAHVSTVEVARDLDVMRALVSDDKLNYFGASYGTYIGATYAGLFPKNVDRMVLDGAIDPLAKPLTLELNQTKGFQTALTAYLQYCVSQGSCPLGNTVDSAQQRLIALFKDLDAHPLATSSGRDLTEGLAFYGVILPLYSRSSWDVETQALQQALQGGGDTLLLLADAYSMRKPDGSYPINSLEVQPAVNCLDHPESETTGQIEAGAAKFLQASPVFGPAATWFPYGCSNWPVRATEPPPDFSAKGAAPIVVVGTTRDPATPYQQAVNLSHELDSGVLLSRAGDGHTAYGQGNSCIDQAVDSYLVDGTPPRDGTRC